MISAFELQPQGSSNNLSRNAKGHSLSSDAARAEQARDNPPREELEAIAASWEDSVAQVGQDIRSLREAQGITLEEIHLKTKVPLSHLRSIETGETQKLPDAIFVRGFLQKICRTLEAETLLAKLPEAQVYPVQSSSLIASSPGLRGNLLAAQLNVAHLYFGYGILLAGAVGGLAWTGQTSQANPVHQAELAPRAAAAAEETIQQKRSARAIATFPSPPFVVLPSLQKPEFSPPSSN